MEHWQQSFCKPLFLLGGPVISNILYLLMHIYDTIIQKIYIYLFNLIYLLIHIFCIGGVDVSESGTETLFF